VIPFLDLAAQHRAIGAELEAAAVEVLRSGQFVLGGRGLAFEQRFAEYCGTRHAVAVNSGTSALHLALLALDVRPGDEVITTPLTFVATVAAILYIGAKPVLVDVDPDTWTMDADRLVGAITPRTKAIIPVHLHGRLADMDRILSIACKYGVAVVEDAAQAHGAESDGRRAGAFGDAGCFSFYPGKNLGACGEGGAVTTDRADVAERVRMLRDWGQDRKYHHVARGYNYRLDEIQAALLEVKLRHIEDWTEARRRLAARYDERLADSGIGRPTPVLGREHVYHVYGVRVADRDSVRREMLDAGAQTGVHYPVPVHLQPAYADLGYGPGDFPIAEAVASEILSLPLFPEMTDEQVDRVSDVLLGLSAMADRYATVGD
jgi:dTDP-4-amino-4,6-dideoxygalactose transaminase